jgi:hypothetical protein
MTLSSAEIRATIMLATAGDGGPLTRACFDGRHEDCGGRVVHSRKFCNCFICHIRVSVIRRVDPISPEVTP